MQCAFDPHCRVNAPLVTLYSIINSLYLHDHRAFCLNRHHKNMVRVNKIIDDVLKESTERASGCRFQCSVHFGKIAWFIDEEVLRHNQEQPLTLKSFSRPFQKIELLHSKSSGLKEQFYPR